MIDKIQPLQPLSPMFGPPKSEETVGAGAPTFLDVFKSIMGETVAAQEQKSRDMLDLMLGDVDDLVSIQNNIVKAQISLEVMTAVKNSVVEAYNEIIKMNI